jgi:phosphosulfolactate synthase (CoM biosynthesis protein A)
MMSQTTVYNSFTGMSPGEKGSLVAFICSHTPNTNKKDVIEALDYALKEKPSFGGFILAMKKDHAFIASIVVNNTGMQGYKPGNIFVYVTIHEDYQNDEQVLKEIMCKALDMSNGDVALNIDPKSPVIQFYQKLGFTQRTLELRLNKKNNSKRVIA